MRNFSDFSTYTNICIPTLIFFSIDADTNVPFALQIQETMAAIRNQENSNYWDLLLEVLIVV